MSHRVLDEIIQLEKSLHLQGDREKESVRLGVNRALIFSVFFSHSQQARLRRFSSRPAR
jgi:hypothetical protein